ncbi:hypothetical protein [Gymnodinialimonas hymeniacidonis]|uniref:hypothetical protein n=1 Tax=Gymnodinialimonas hymeniacidonis TaxID=3126508 RepID=UPI0034C6585C
MSAIATSLPHDAVSSDQISNRFWPTLLTLAFGAFVIGTSEFLIMGILPDVAASLGVSVGAAGQLVTAFAFGIALQESASRDISDIGFWRFADAASVRRCNTISAAQQHVSLQRSFKRWPDGPFQPYFRRTTYGELRRGQDGRLQSECQCPQ